MEENHDQDREMGSRAAQRVEDMRLRDKDLRYDEQTFVHERIKIDATKHCINVVLARDGYTGDLVGAS